MVKFIMPLDSPRITSKFGWRTHPVTGKKESWHQGVDFVSTTLGSKAPIHTVADGTVSYAGNLSTYGLVVRVKHLIDGVKYESLYAHLSKINVKVGQKVKQGDIVGIIGTTGRSTGIHLHAELHVNGYWTTGQPNAKNMMDYINIKDTPSTLKNKGELTMSQYKELKDIIDAQAKTIKALEVKLNDKLDKPKSNNIPSSWAKEAWDWLKSTKDKKGNALTDGTNPQGYITREQVATILHRYENKK